MSSSFPAKFENIRGYLKKKKIEIQRKTRQGEIRCSAARGRREARKKQGTARVWLVDGAECVDKSCEPALDRAAVSCLDYLTVGEEMLTLIRG